MLEIQSDDDSSFDTPKGFLTVTDASLSSGIPISSMKSTKRTQKPLTCKAIGYTYTITWKPPRSKAKCVDCHVQLFDCD